MSHTKEQESIVLKVLSYKPNQFYEILAVTKSADETEIKKSYRKLAIKCHPDKNPHPRASEAFKFINKAWGVLSDPQKKKIYDQTGADPDSRFESSGAGASGFSSGTHPMFNGGAGRGGVPFDDDIFNLFFGGGNSPFGGQTFTFGNNGFTFQSFGGGDSPFMRHRRTHHRPRQGQSQSGTSQQEQQQNSTSEMLRALLPLLLVLIVPILTSLFTGELSGSDYSFSPTSKYNIERRTPRYSIPYYVTNNFEQKFSGKSAKQMRNFDNKVESIYVQDKRSKCSREQIHKNELIEDAQGWFWTDEDKLKRAENMPMPNCDFLRGIGLI